jgi:hypothetical protein
MIKLLILSLLTFNAYAVNTATPIGAAKIQEYGSGFRNYVKNPSSFRNTESTATSSAAIARDTDTADKLDGIASFTCDASAQNGYCEWTLDTIAEGDKTGSCEFKGSFKGDGSLYKAQIMESSTVVSATSVLGNQSDWYEFSVNAPCGSTRTVRITQTESGTAPAINVGRMYYGKPTNIGSVSQAIFYAGMSQVGAAGCTYSENSSSGFSNFIDLGTGAGCNAWTTSGVATAVGTNDHRITLSSLPRGEYEVLISAAVGNGTSSGACIFRLSDATTTYGTQVLGVNSAIDIPQIRFKMSKTTDSGSTTLKVQASDNHASTCSLGNADANVVMSWTINRFPTSSETVVRSENAWWKVDANISGANPSLGTASVSSYTGITNSGLTLTNNSGTGNITSQIGCSSTNAPTGTTCSVGDESVAIAFTPVGSFPQDVLACASFGHYLTLGTNSAVTDTFQIVETATNAQTILQEGKSRSLYTFTTPASAITGGSAQRVCGNFTFTSSGQKMLRLMYEQEINAGTISTSVVQADGDTGAGQPDIHWEVYPLNVAKPATTYAGSVTSNSSGLIRIESARIALAASPTISLTSSNWISAGTRHGTGDNSFTLSAGLFSATPVCTCTAHTVASDTPRYGCNIVLDGPSSNTNLRINGGQSGSDFDITADVICMGPR